MSDNPYLPQALRALMPTTAGSDYQSDGMVALRALSRRAPEEATWTCPDCGKAVKPTCLGNLYIPAGHCKCPGGLARMAETRGRWAEQDEEKHERSVRERLARTCEIDPAQTFEAWTVDTKARRQALETAQKVAKRLQAGGWGIWWGPYGCGKTHLANAIAYSLVIDYGIPARVVNWLAQLREIQMAWSETGAIQPEQAIWRTMTETKVLFLDDFDKGLPKPEDLAKSKLPSSWYMESLYYVIDTRYRKHRATVVISNQPIADLTVVMQAIGGTSADAVLSRFSRSGASSVDWGRIGLTEYAQPVDVPMF